MDMVSAGRDVIWPWEAQRVAEEWADHFEQELEAPWTAQAKARRLVLIEPGLTVSPGAQVDGGPGNGQKIWASQFTGMPDVAHYLAYFQAVASGFMRNEVIAATEEARDRARKPKWVPNPYSGPAGADQRGLVMSNNAFLYRY